MMPFDCATRGTDLNLLLKTFAVIIVPFVVLATLSPTSAGFTDSTFGSSSLTIAPGLDSPPVHSDQSAASSLFVSSRGDLYVSGYRGTGDGNGDATVSPRADPTRVDFPHGVRIVDAGGSTNDFHAPWADTTSYMALDSQGAVWTWGQVYGVKPAGHRLIGRGAISVADSRKAGQVTRTQDGAHLPEIVSIARIENQFLALDGKGTLWAWGYGGENLPNPRGARSEMLPFAVRMTTATPSALPCTGNSGNNLGEVRWRSIWGGTNSAGAVGQNGLVYSWGFDNTDGLSPAIVNTRCPSLNEGANRALFQRYPRLYRTSDGLSYDENKLRTEAERHARYEEIVADMATDTLEECTGTLGSRLTDTSGCPVRQLGFSAGAARMLTTDGELLTWVTRPGYGEQFLGRVPTSTEPAHSPAPIDGGIEFSAVTAGVSSLTALSEAGEVYGWGANNACQAVGSPSRGGRISTGDCASVSADAVTGAIRLPTAVRGVPKGARVASVASTQCASWAVLDDGHIFAWGAGTVAGAFFSQCITPAKAQQGYKIYLYGDADGTHPFGEPVTAPATATVQVR